MVGSLHSPVQSVTARRGSEGHLGALAFALAVVEFVLVGFGVHFPVDDPLRNVAFGLALTALGLLLPRYVTLPRAPSGD